MKVKFNKPTVQGTYYIVISNEKYLFPSINSAMSSIIYNEKVWDNIDEMFYAPKEEKVTPCLIIEFTKDKIIYVDEVIQYVKNKIEKLEKIKEIENKFIDEIEIQI